MEKGRNNRGKKGMASSGSDQNNNKPRQPQRGMGVAQLEEIRLRNQFSGGMTSSSSSFASLHPNEEEEARLRIPLTLPLLPHIPSSSGFGHFQDQYLVVGFGDQSEGRSVGYTRPQHCSTVRNHGTNRAAPVVTLPLLRQSDEQESRRRNGGQNQWNLDSDHSSGAPYELDLELKLSR